MLEHDSRPSLPGWLPDAARNYLFHTETGCSIRELARIDGCHASTVMRQIRRLETRRDDPLVDEALRQLGQQMSTGSQSTHSKDRPMNAETSIASNETTDASLFKEARQVLRRLDEPDAILAVAADMENAVVVRDLPDGRSLRTAVISRDIAHAIALKDWIHCDKPGRIMRYKLTSAGRAALKRLQPDQGNGFNDAQSLFAGQHRDWDQKSVHEDGETKPRRVRYNAAESPLTGLARRRDRDGQPFLSDDLVAAGEQLREDFELSQMGPRVAQNWDRFLTVGDRGSFGFDSGGGDSSARARERVAAALADLGPGLGDVVLRCCCYLEGMEATEKHMGWSARSGKIVLRIALQRLKRHYEEAHGKFGPMIG
ncbi:DUF6456 domain-containing protein [Poseidonocella pacifica]|uniref:DUF6456 domain-containing protein n=1 Tax=Poseidonocella pacifica TaxID=871651 RepID=UPI000B86AEFE|nr:DUF6456 domain-containing protein [Poseidonocella pacifica]